MCCVRNGAWPVLGSLFKWVFSFFKTTYGLNHCTINYDCNMFLCVWSLATVVTARKRSLRRLCFHRCLSVHEGGVCPIACWDTHPQQVPPGRYTPPGRHPPFIRAKAKAIFLFDLCPSLSLLNVNMQLDYVWNHLELRRFRFRFRYLSNINEPLREYPHPHQYWSMATLENRSQTHSQASPLTSIDCWCSVCL